MSKPCVSCGYDPGFDAVVCPRCSYGASMVHGSEAALTVVEPGRPHRGTIPSTDSGAVLFVVSGPDSGRQFPIHDSSVLGREAADGVALSDTHISRCHARIRRIANRYVYQDMQGTNGSYLVVNGQRVRLRGPHTLRDDDEIGIGQTVVRFMRLKKEATR